MAKNPCIITGCDLYDVAHNRWCHGDLFEIGDCYVFNGVVRKSNEPLWRETQFSDMFLSVMRVDSSFERRGVFVIEKCNAHLNKVARDYIQQ